MRAARCLAVAAAFAGLPIGITFFLAACSSGSSGPVGLFDLTVLNPLAVPATASDTALDFYALPYPNDLRLDPDGTPALARYHRADALLGTYVDVIDANARGFGPTQAVYFRFDAPLLQDTLPVPSATLLVGASVFLVDVTPGGAHRGEKLPVLAQFNPTHLDFIGDNWLAVRPVPGVPPRQGSTYAAVVTDGVSGATGKTQIADSLRRVLTNAPSGLQEVQAAKVYAPLRAWLAEQGDLINHVTHATVFTTADVTSIMDRLRTAVYATTAPSLASLAHQTSAAQYDLFTATYNAENFQEGTSPYTTTGGAIHIGNDGLPASTRTEVLRVAMSIPKGTMPSRGWPVVIYAHGTGGGYESFVQDGTADRLARVISSDGTELARFAVVSIDQVLHGTRAPVGTDPNTAFFNFNNLIAAHDNPKQGALDDFQLLRLVTSINVGSAPSTSASIQFDASLVYFFGHSQGSLTGALYVAAEPNVQAAVFSGAGGGLIAGLLEKKKPIDVGAVVASLLGGPVDASHPMLNLLQGYFDDSDPANYARRFFVEPPPGATAKSVYISLGLRDSYAPVPTIETFALASGVHPVLPQLVAVTYLPLTKLTFEVAPQVDNVAGLATGVLCEYDPGEGEGHFVVFDVPAAEHQSTRFLATHAASGMARLDLP